MRDDIRWGLTVGALMAVGYAGLMVVVASAADADEIEVLIGLVAFGAAGLGSGLLLGLLKRKITSRLRAMLLGIVIAYPASLVLTMTSDDTILPIDRVDFITSVITAIIFGPVGGYFFGPSGTGRDSAVED